MAACARPPNGLRLSGDDGKADGVRCSRGLGDRVILLILRALAPTL
jgi:hypothetical protein